MNKLINEIVGKDQKMISYASPTDPLPKRLLINSVELITGRRKIEKAYKELKELGKNDVTIWHHLFPLLGINLDFDRTQISKIPKTGPVVIIANHPFGVIDGLCLGYILSLIRSDFQLIVNEVLCKEELLGKYLLPIDFRETKEAMRTNILTKQSAMHLLNERGALGIFPSGGVATAIKPFSKRVEDLEWKNFILKVIKKSNPTIVPIFFHGQNSQLFQIASHINQNLRLSLLLNEINNKRGKTLKLEIGNPIKSKALSGLKPLQILSALRQATFELKG